MTHLVHDIGHIKLNTNCYQDVVKDLTEILGLRVTYSDEDQVWLSSNGRAAEVVLYKANENSAHTIGLSALTAEAVREAETRVESAGCRILSSEPSMNCIDAGVTFATPEGLRFEIHTPVREDITKRRHPTVGVGPNRMDHINLLTPDPVATRTQLEAICGLKVSERLVDDMETWLYGGNRAHHILGLVRNKVGLHHYSFEFSSFNDYLSLGDLLDAHDKEMLWGPGRHRPGDNTYAYFVEASGAIVECSANMSMIPDDAHFEPNVITNLKRPDNVRDMNVWGTPAPQVWLKHYFPFAEID